MHLMVIDLQINLFKCNQTMYIMYVFMTYLKIADETNRRSRMQAGALCRHLCNMRFLSAPFTCINAPHWKPGQHSESLLQLLSPRDQVQTRVFLNCSSPQHALKADATYNIAGILRTNTPRINRFVFFIRPPIFIRE